jgi:hypothetical protein
MYGLSPVNGRFVRFAPPECGFAENKTASSVLQAICPLAADSLNALLERDRIVR